MLIAGYTLVDKQGVTGRKVQYHSVPYKSITHFSVETAGTFDLDAELGQLLVGRARAGSEDACRRSARRIDSISRTVIGWEVGADGSGAGQQHAELVASEPRARIIVIPTGIVIAVLAEAVGGCHHLARQLRERAPRGPPRRGATGGADFRRRVPEW